MKLNDIMACSCKNSDKRWLGQEVKPEYKLTKTILSSWLLQNKNAFYKMILSYTNLNTGKKM